MNVQDPARSRILSLNPAEATVLAWALEALSSDRIENKPGFLASMLLSAYAPPPDLEQLVRLPVSDWLLLAKAARDTRATGRAELPPYLAPHFEALYPRFGRLDPAHWPILLPFPAAAHLEEEAMNREEEQDEPLSAPDNPKSEIQNPKSVWLFVLADLRTQMDPSTFNAWLKGAEVIHVDGNRWTVAVRSQTAVDWLRHRLLTVIERTVQRVVGKPIKVEFEAR